MSFWLEIRKRGGGEMNFAKKLPDPASGRVGPYTLRHWADQEGLAIEYIDNCHVKVPVDRNKRLAYLSEPYEAHDPYPASELPILTSEWSSSWKPKNSDPETVGEWIFGNVNAENDRTQVRTTIRSPNLQSNSMFQYDMPI